MTESWIFISQFHNKTQNSNINIKNIIWKEERDFILRLKRIFTLYSLHDVGKVWQKLLIDEIQPSKDILWAEFGICWLRKKTFLVELNKWLKVVDCWK